MGQSSRTCIAAIIAWSNATAARRIDARAPIFHCDDSSSSSLLATTLHVARELASVHLKLHLVSRAPSPDMKTIHNYEHQCPHPPARPVHHDNQQRIIIRPSQADDHGSNREISQINQYFHQIKCHM